MRPTAALAALLLSGLMFSATTLTASANSLQPVTPPTPMPAFHIPGLNGTSGSDTDLRN